MAAPLHVYVIAGEESGDQLGAKLMQALTARLGTQGVRFSGIGGHRMAAEGLESLFPLADIAVMGILPVLARLPTLVARVYAAVASAVAARPDALVVIDSPDFTHAVAKRVRRRLPDLPIINYVSPSVWAWRPGRARKMRPYVDHVLALKPFEVDAHQRLGGPDCTYVGHPLIERLADLRPAAGERRPINEPPLEVLVLPGSRRSEIARLMEPFGAALGLLNNRHPAGLRVTLPAVPHLVDEIRRRAAEWPQAPQIVLGEEAKFAAFRKAHVALAASGTVTLELALAGVPMVVAYRVSKLEEQVKHFLTVDTIVLANLVLGENVVPELLQEQCAPEPLARALEALCQDGDLRRRQVEAFRRLDDLMGTGEETPSGRAARVIVETIAAKGRSRPQI